MTTDPSVSKAIYTAYLEGSLKLSKTGEWWHEGRPFANLRLAELFHHSIVWAEVEKRYFVQIGQQRASFDCEDTAYFVLQVDETATPWQLSVSDGSTEQLDPKSLSLGLEDQIYCTIKGFHRARLSRSAHQQILTHVVSENQLSIGGQTIIMVRV